MTRFKIEQLVLASEEIASWAQTDNRHVNWPVVYTLADDNTIYIGESLSASTRLRQHLDSEDKKHLDVVRVVIDDTFNKSVCLDLESYLIRLFSGEGRYRVLNHNAGITNADYYDRSDYQEIFDDIFRKLQDLGAFRMSIAEIENSDLFKLSPFKSLTSDQTAAVQVILRHLLSNLKAHRSSTTVVDGEPGTGKTVVAIFLMKIIRDIAGGPERLDGDSDSAYSDFFTEANRKALSHLKFGIVVPQQSLRASVKKVFGKTPGLDAGMVLSAFEVGQSKERFDLLLVDETHRLNQRANQSSGTANADFAAINQRLFGEDNPARTQLDWIRKQSDHQIFFLDPRQSVRPADLPHNIQAELIDTARREEHYFKLWSQMRVQGGGDYIDYVRRILSPNPPHASRVIDNYEFCIFAKLGEMRDAIRKKDKEVGLARLVAGYAWEWKSKGKNNRAAYDIEVDGCHLRWNQTPTDWINSPGSIDEVGSIHTVQGYDLNYCGVIIGPDLGYDPEGGGLFIQRDNYFDKKGKEDNRRLGIKYSDEDLLEFIRNIYVVLLTRGMLGTYVYVCDPGLRAYMADYVGAH